MSVPEQNIRAFIDVFQSGLIPEPHQQDLNRLVNNLPDKDELICQEIDNWLKVETRAGILTAYEERLRAIIDAENFIELGPGRTEPNTTPNQPGESLKEQLNNAIQPISKPFQPSVSEDE